MIENDLECGRVKHVQIEFRTDPASCRSNGILGVIQSTISGARSLVDGGYLVSYPALRWSPSRRPARAGTPDDHRRMPPSEECEAQAFADGAKASRMERCSADANPLRMCLASTATRLLQLLASRNPSTGRQATWPLVASLRAREPVRRSRVPSSPRHPYPAPLHVASRHYP